MPKTRQRGKNGHTHTLSHADKQRIYDSWVRKIDEYMAMPIEQLETLRDSGTFKGTYEKALLRAIEMKQELLNKQNAQNGNDFEGSNPGGNLQENAGNQLVTTDDGGRGQSTN